MYHISCTYTGNVIHFLYAGKVLCSRGFLSVLNSIIAVFPYIRERFIFPHGTCRLVMHVLRGNWKTAAFVSVVRRFACEIMNVENQESPSVHLQSFSDCRDTGKCPESNEAGKEAAELMQSDAELFRFLYDTCCIIGGYVTCRRVNPTHRGYKIDRRNVYEYCLSDLKCGMMDIC